MYSTLASLLVLLAHLNFNPVQAAPEPFMGRTMLTPQMIAAIVKPALVPNIPPPPINAPLIDISPPALNVEPNQAHCDLQVKLKQKPNCKVIVYMQASNFGFDSGCKLVFTPDNWNVPQKLRAIPLPYFTDATTVREVEATFKLEALTDPAMNKNELKYKITRGKGKAAICQSNGDPHYQGFNGQRYDFMGKGGNYYLVRSPFWTVQTQTGHYTGSAYINKVMALRYGKTVYIVDADKGMTCKTSTPGVQVTESNNKKDFHFKLSDGSEVKVYIKNALNKNYLDITVEAAEHAKGKVSGLCGNWQEPADNRFCDPRNIPVAKLEDWGETWRVPANDDIFQCMDNCPGAMDKSMQPSSIDFCRIPEIGDAKHPTPSPIQPPMHNYQVARPNPWFKVSPPKITYRPTSTKKCTESHAKRCEDICKRAIFHPLAEEFLASEPYLSECRRDCRDGGTFDSVDNSKGTYFARLRTLEKSLECGVEEALRRIEVSKAVAAKGAYGLPPAQFAPPPTEALSKVQQIAEKLYAMKSAVGLGDSYCPKPNGRECNGKGSCVSAGCACLKGWTGSDCTIDLATLGFVVVGNVYTNQIAPPTQPAKLPGCKQGALQMAAAAAELSQEIPSVAGALVQNLEGPPIGNPEEGPAMVDPMNGPMNTDPGAPEQP